MKQAITLLMILMLVGLAACGGTPQDVPRAEVVDKPVESAPEPTPEPEPVEEPKAEETPAEPNEEVKAEEPSDEVVKKSLSADSTFEFQGFKVGKDHVGGFDDFTGSLHFMGDKIVGADLEIKSDSVFSDAAGLTNHLKADDFFDVANHPTITAKASSIEDGKVTGDLTFLGVTKEITYPVTVTDNSVSTDFMLDTTPFGMKNLGVNKEVRIFFTLKAE